MLVEIGDGRCLTPPPGLLVYERESPGVGVWTHEGFVLRRTLPALIPFGQNFEVTWALEPTELLSGSIRVVDFFPSDGGTDPPGGASAFVLPRSVTFEDFPMPGEVEELSYLAAAGDPGGLLLGNLIELRLTGEPVETVTTSTVHPIEDPFLALPPEGEDRDADGVADDADTCKDTSSDADAGVPSRRLGPNRWVWDRSEGWITSSGEGSDFELVATLGCSCSQILDALAGLSGGSERSHAGHRRFGCSRSLLEGWIAGDPFEEIGDALQVPADGD
jgi:hypothetical protein